MNSIHGFVDNDAADKDDCTDDGTVFPTTIPDAHTTTTVLFHASSNSPATAGLAPVQSHPCPNDKIPHPQSLHRCQLFVIVQTAVLQTRNSTSSTSMEHRSDIAVCSGVSPSSSRDTLTAVTALQKLYDAPTLRGWNR
jgi:hypothetical protein